jgi:hypothetical protein
MSPDFKRKLIAPGIVVSSVKKSRKNIHRNFTYRVSMPRCLLNFHEYKDNWTVHFLEQDCQTRIGAVTRYYQFPTVDSLRAFVLRCNPENVEKFEHSLKTWGQGSAFVLLTDEQYLKLKNGTPRPSRPQNPSAQQPK